MKLVIKMKKLTFSKKTEKYCQYCLYGKYLEYTDEVFCTKKGFVNKFDKCIKYKYDPIKRIPEKARPNFDFSKEDFQL